MRRGVAAAGGGALLLGAVLLAVSVPGASAAPPALPSWSANVRADASNPIEAKAAGQNEPYVAVDESGLTYVSWQSSPNGVALSRTTDGHAFAYLGNPDTTKAGFSDVTMAPTTWTYPDRAKSDAAGEGGLAFGVLGPTQCAPAIAGIRGAYSSNQGNTWQSNDAGCQPAEVDRPWTAAYTPPQYRGTSAALDHTFVYNFYHDFTPLGTVWVARSTDGGKTWLSPETLVAQPGSVQQAGSLCNTTPGSISVDQRGAHPGRVYAVWASSDLVTNIQQGCNYTQAQAFDHLYFSYSDDNGATWTSGTVFNDPCAPSPPLPPANPQVCQDIAEFWTSTAVDDAGNVYQAFPWRDVTAAKPEYDIYVAVAKARADGSVVFDKPRRANVGTGSHFSPWIVAGSAGQIDVAYYSANAIAGVGAFNKPATTPPNTLFNVQLAQSLDGGQSFTETTVTDHYNYFGDYCTVGIFCGPQAKVFGWAPDRILYENLGLAVGPDGGARVAWTDTRNAINADCQPGPNSTPSCQAGKTHVYFSCQTGGPGLHGETVTGCGQSTRPQVAASSPTGGMPNTASVPGVLMSLGGAIVLLLGVATRGRRRPAEVNAP